MSFPSSSEFVAAFYLPFVRGCPRPRGACYRVPLPFATSVHEVHLPASFPPWPMFRPQRFARSRRLPPSRTLQACFILLPRPGFALQGVSPLPSRLASSASRALVSFGGSLLPASCPAGASSSRPAFRALLRAAIRCSRPAVKPAGYSIPSYAFNSCGLSSEHLGDAFTSPPLLTFTPRRSLSVAKLVSSVSIDARPDFLSPDCLSRPSFPACPSPPPKRWFRVRPEDRKSVV